MPFSVANRSLTAFVLTLFLWALAIPAGADYLVTRDGKQISTLGAWQRDAERVIYLDLARQPAIIPADQIDFQASKKLTAESHRVRLFATSWCGYCRRARALLEQLNVPFSEWDVERDPKARAEMTKLVGARSGVPILTIDGKLVRGFREDVIRQLVGEMKAKGSDSRQATPASP